MYWNPSAILWMKSSSRMVVMVVPVADWNSSGIVTGLGGKHADQGQAFHRRKKNRR
jgi:hypothetical protein